MKINKFLMLFLVIGFTVLQCTALEYIRIFKVKPDILLILIIFFSLYYGRTYGLIVGALCGIFSEATSGMPAGFTILTYSLAGLILGHIGRWVYNQKIFSQIGISFIFIFVIYLTLLFAFRAPELNRFLSDILIFIILPASLYTACLTPVLFYFLKLILNLTR